MSSKHYQNRLNPEAISFVRSLPGLDPEVTDFDIDVTCTYLGVSSMLVTGTFPRTQTGRSAMSVELAHTVAYNVVPEIVDLIDFKGIGRRFIENGITPDPSQSVEPISEFDFQKLWGQDDPATD